MERLSNPFPITGYHGPEYFCDREKECDRLMAAAKNGRNVTLIARRRIGKTSLLQHFAWKIKHATPSWQVIYIDLIKTNSLRGLYESLASALFVARDKSKKLPDLNLMARLRMTISMDPLTQLPQTSFDLKESQLPQSLQFLFDWVKGQKRIIVAFDEFQQILNYPEKDVEAIIRSEMQRLPEVRFIFSGSDQQFLDEMFNRQHRPFYQSTESMDLLPIDAGVYQRFIETRFGKFNREITHEASQFILSLAGGETFAVQRLCNALFEVGYPLITVPLVQEVLFRVLDQQQPNYERIRALLDPQSNLFKVLRAIAKLGVVTETYGKDILQASRLHNASSVNKAVQSLYKHGVISQTITTKGEKGYVVDDALFRIWLSGLSD